MERLGFTEQSTYQATEASYHIARYLITKPFCPGKKILDAACGEGYGSHLMSLWGAKSVLGIDVSREAINSAKINFIGENVCYETRSVYDINSEFSNEKFNLIVSLETIEHLEKPDIFLREIKAAASDDATIIISCPNDPMLYEKNDDGNPFHLHRYTANDFFGLTEGILGKCAAKIIGTPLGGTGNFLIGSDCLEVGNNQLSMMEGNLKFEGPVAQVPPDDLIDLGTATYYIGIWGNCPEGCLNDLVTFYPSNIKSAAQNRLQQDVKTLSDMVTALKTKIWNLEHLPAREDDELRVQLRHHALKIQSLTAENAIAREGIRTLQAKVEAGDLAFTNLLTQIEADKDVLAAVPWRAVGLYRRIRRMIPHRILIITAKIIDKVRR